MERSGLKAILEKALTVAASSVHGLKKALLSRLRSPRMIQAPCASVLGERQGQAF
jgi:hypothetical protein